MSESWIRVCKDPATGLSWHCMPDFLFEDECGLVPGPDGPTIPAETAGELHVPSMIGGMSVQVICGGAFRGCTRLTRVTIPYGVEAICGGAFFGCSALREISLPLEADTFSIGKDAFKGCTALRRVVIPFAIEESLATLKACFEPTTEIVRGDMPEY